MVFDTVMPAATIAVKQMNEFPFYDKPMRSGRTRALIIRARKAEGRPGRAGPRDAAEAQGGVPGAGKAEPSREDQANGDVGQGPHRDRRRATAARDARVAAPRPTPIGTRESLALAQVAWMRDDFADDPKRTASARSESRA